MIPAVSLFFAFHCLVSLVLAGLIPTAPGPGESFNAGSPCEIKWNVDMTGTWTNVSIDLMSGSNSDMIFVANVVTALDGTDATRTPFSWTCPEVDPYSSIYFYQFTNGNDHANAQWTTRFTIASLNGESTSPLSSKQSNGDQVPWGIGSLIDEVSQSDHTKEGYTDGLASDNNRQVGKEDGKSGKHSGETDNSSEDHSKESGTSIRMRKHPRPTASPSPSSPMAEQLNPTPGLPCLGIPNSSVNCTGTNLVNKGIEVLIVPFWIYVSITGLWVLWTVSM